MMRRLEDLGAKGGDSSHLGATGDKIWFTGEARGLARVLETLRKAGVEKGDLSGFEREDLPAWCLEQLEDGIETEEQLAEQRGVLALLVDRLVLEAVVSVHPNHLAGD
ncbi:MAG: uncharacterized protein A8A55_1900 [Amphiamblys sp. WSBS2006]|nr:MAG: uncharacterized protein A8A55_1900 [Amphiamblys sp. WSBS2006]